MAVGSHHPSSSDQELLETNDRITFLIDVCKHGGGSVTQRTDPPHDEVYNLQQGVTTKMIWAIFLNLFLSVVLILIMWFFWRLNKKSRASAAKSKLLAPEASAAERTSKWVNSCGKSSGIARRPREIRVDLITVKKETDNYKDGETIMKPPKKKAKP